MIAHWPSELVSLTLWAIAISVLTTYLVRRNALPQFAYWIGLAATPPLAFLFRGILGEASFALPAFAMAATGLVAAKPTGRIFFIFLAALSLTILSSALGLFKLDLYGLGYFPHWTLTLVAGLVIGAYFSFPVLGIFWMIGLVIYAVGAHPSPNIWDILMDVPSTLLAFKLAFSTSHRAKTSN